MEKAATVAAYIGLALALAGVLVLLEPPAGLGTPGHHAMTVDGPDGTIWNGTITADRNTPLALLFAAAERGDFTVEVRGTGATAYVVAVAGYAEEGSGGWCYAVERNGAWMHPTRSAGAFVLTSGDAVRWHWAQGPGECGGPPA